MSWCVCQGIAPVDNDIKVVLLQHPQEAKNPLGTARLISLTLKSCTHRVGLSWRSLSAAVGEPAEPSKWAVLFLGTNAQSSKLLEEPGLHIVNSKGKPVDISQIEGILLLDGNWKQSKTLWWRNAWMTRLNRAVVNADDTSAYRELRRQPRKSCLSTLEATAEILTGLKSPGGPELKKVFGEFLTAARGVSLQ